MSHPLDVLQWVMSCAATTNLVVRHLTGGRGAASSPVTTSGPVSYQPGAITSGHPVRDPGILAICQPHTGRPGLRLPADVMA
jgi:hypothetical protein